MSGKQGVKLQIRWLIRRDMAEVLRIEKESFASAWWEEDFLCCLRHRNQIGMVAEQDREIVGFMIYELDKSRIRILNFAVAPEARRQGVGGQMVCQLINKLTQQRRKEIMLDVPETNLSAQLFFQSQGFRAVQILRDHYDKMTENAYVMRYRLADASQQSTPHLFTNRISEHEPAWWQT